MLFHTGSAVFVWPAPATALAAEPRRDRVASDKLRALIEAHATAYAAFGNAIHEKGGGSCDKDTASRLEERALLAVCAYPAVSDGDRMAKAGYLLEIEARGELDLSEQIQVLLRSTMPTS